MKILLREGKKIYDGELSEKDISFSPISFKNTEYIISEPSTIEKISNASPDEIANILNLKVVDFDGIKIYHGSKKGLKLCYQDLNDNFSAIFSFGEYQPNRFICIFEGIIEK